MRLDLPAVAVSLLCLTTGAFAQGLPAPGPVPAAPQAPPRTVPVTPPSTAASAAQLHDEIRRMRDGALAALGRGDVNGILAHLHPNIIFAPMNGEIVRGPLQIRDYFNRMLKGPDRRVQNIQLKLDVAELADLYGNTAVAYGTSEGYYKLTNGMEFTVNTNWTASLVRDNGKWLLTSFQAAPDVFDNPILEMQKKAAALQGGIAGLVTGLVLGLLLLTWSWKRRRAKARAAATV
jgi:ketosteroid isomerase-like protein